MRKVFLKNIVFTIAFALLTQAPAWPEKIETKSSPNYLIVLVHGINTSSRLFNGEDVGNRKGQRGSDLAEEPDMDFNIAGIKVNFGDLKGYLENDLGLKGYVYSYTFSERDGRIDLMANELGNPDNNNKAYIEGGWLHLKNSADIPREKTKIKIGDEGKGNAWLKQAREDFIDWFKNPLRNPNNPSGMPPTKEEIPQKYIIIAHSLGGIASRAYISSNFYQDDVAGLITLDSQHMGAEGALALKRMYEFYESNQDTTSFVVGLAMAILAFENGWDDLGNYLTFSSFGLLAGRTVVDNLLIKGWLGWYPDQPGVQDVGLQSGFMQTLNAKDFVKGNKPMKVRFVSGDGIPTPSGDLPANRYIFGLSALQTLLSEGYLNELPLGAKIMALYMSEVMGAIVNQSGDIYSTGKSQLGEGLLGLTKDNIDFKSYSVRFGTDAGALEDIAMGAATAISAVNLGSMFVPQPIIALSKFAIAVGAGTLAYTAFQDRLRNYLCGHGLIVKKAYEEKIIDQALDGIIPIGGRAQSVHKSGISAASVSAPTASYPAPEQAFVLLSDLDSDKKSTGVFHTVTIEAITEGQGSSAKGQGGILFPIEFNGQKKWVSAMMVKEAPTAIKGVINTFLPKKLKQFQYSENFAAWKDVGAVDEWGNFIIKDLKLAEGQNVLSGPHLIFCPLLSSRVYSSFLA